MRVCFIVGEVFGYGGIGGYGKLTIDIAKGLVEKGIEVFILTRKTNAKDSLKQRTIERKGKIDIIALPNNIGRFRKKELYKLTQSDIYHSQATSIESWFTMKYNPKSKHVITFQDPLCLKESWKVIAQNHKNKNIITKTKNKIIQTIAKYYFNKAVHNADKLYCQANYIRPIVKKMYKLNHEPKFLPNPVKIPKEKIKKSSTPTVCFLGRLELQKRPEIFFELAKKFPDIKFVCIGKSIDERRDKYFRKKYKNIKNLDLVGFVNEEEKSYILHKSWILINTSIRECLPVSFLEATAHKCAILSSVNPDNFASNFGYLVKKDDYKEGLKYLLENNRWKKLGERGYEYVKENHEFNKVINQHIKIYEELIKI